MKCHIHFLLSVLSLSVLAGCASSLSPDVYTAGNAGQVHHVVKGVVISSRVVQVTADNNGLDVGGIAGGALGAIAGSEISSKRPL